MHRHYHFVTYSYSFIHYIFFLKLLISVFAASHVSCRVVCVCVMTNEIAEQKLLSSDSINILYISQVENIRNLITMVFCLYFLFMYFSPLFAGNIKLLNFFFFHLNNFAFDRKFHRPVLL